MRYNLVGIATILGANTCDGRCQQLSKNLGAGVDRSSTIETYALWQSMHKSLFLSLTTQFAPGHFPPAYGRKRQLASASHGHLPALILHPLHTLMHPCISHMT